jgi:nitrate reductase gamma subunit
MPNPLLPPEERNLTPAQVEALDKRRDLGHTLLVMAGQFTAVAIVLLLWIGQDLSYSPGKAHPMFYYFLVAIGFVLAFGISGLFLRRGMARID